MQVESWQSVPKLHITRKPSVHKGGGQLPWQSVECFLLKNNFSSFIPYTKQDIDNFVERLKNKQHKFRKLYLYLKGYRFARKEEFGTTTKRTKLTFIISLTCINQKSFPVRFVRFVLGFTSIPQVLKVVKSTNRACILQKTRHKLRFFQDKFGHIK